MANGQGLLNQAPSMPAQDGGQQEKKDPLIEKIISGVEEKVDPQLKDTFSRILVAGMKILYSDQTHHFLVQGLQQGVKSNNVPGTIVAGAVKLIAAVMKASQGKVPMQTFAAASLPAGIVLMCHMAEFAEATGNFQVTSDMMANMTKGFLQQLLKLYKITPQMLAQGAQYNQSQKGGKGAPAPAGAPPAQPPMQAPGPQPGAGASPVPAGATGMSGMGGQA